METGGGFLIAAPHEHARRESSMPAGGTPTPGRRLVPCRTDTPASAADAVVEAPAADPARERGRDARAARTDPGDHRTLAAGAVLVAGAFAVVLAGADSEVFDLERHLVPKALALHATALLLLVLGAPSFRRLREGGPALFLTLFVAWGGLSAAFAENRWLAFQAWGVSFSSLALLLAALRVGESRRWGVMAGVLAAAVLGAAIGVAQAYGADWPWLAESRAPGGTFGNRNFLAHLSAIALGPLLVVSARSRGRWLALALLGLAVLVAAIVLTRSRAAWLAASASLVVTIVTLALAWRRSGTGPCWGRLAAVVLVVGAGVAAAVAFPNELRWATDAPYARTLERLGDYRGGSGAGRLVQYRRSLLLVPGRPVLGVGPGNWFVHYPRVTGPGDPSYSGHLTIPTNPWPSSDWVAMVTERGPVGALLLLMTGAAAAWVGVRGRRRTGDSGEAPAPPRGPHAGAVVVGALTAVLITGLFDAVLLLAAPSFFTWVLVGLALPIAPPRPTVAPGAAARVAVRGGAVLVTLVLLVVTAGSTAALVLTRESRSTEALSRAASVAPWEHRLQLLLAERGHCAAAGRAAALMPHHAAPARLASGCN